MLVGQALESDFSDWLNNRVSVIPRNADNACGSLPNEKAKPFAEGESA